MKLACVPSQLDFLMVALIPKASGGERTIGICPSALRIMSKLIRRIYGSSWLRANDRPYLFGRKGISALSCIWRQALTTEHATYFGQSAATAMLDIAKA